MDYDRDELFGEAAVYKITPNGVRTTFASGLSYPSYLAVDKAGNLFVADYDDGIIYRIQADRIASHLCLRVASPCRYGFRQRGQSVCGR